MVLLQIFLNIFLYHYMLCILQISQILAKAAPVCEYRLAENSSFNTVRGNLESKCCNFLITGQLDKIETFFKFCRPTGRYQDC